MKYRADCWAHVHFNVEIEADSFEEAERLINDGMGEDEVDWRPLDYGDGGITSIIDENGKQYWPD